MIILAAGESVRMGTSKQLLRYSGETLLRRIALAGKASKCGTVSVILGANRAGLIGELNRLDIEIVENRRWRDGMSTSIVSGLDRLLEINPDLRAAVIAVCDQPFVNGDVIDGLIGRYNETMAPIVASAYGRNTGVPALFDRRLFPHLRNLEGRGGAKQLINRFSDEALAVPFPEGEIDIDTPEDYALLQKSDPEV